MVVRATIEDLNEGAIDSVGQALEEGGSDSQVSSQEGLDAVFGHIVIGVALHLGQQAMQQLPHWEQVLVLGLPDPSSDHVEIAPHVPHQVSPEAIQDEVHIEEGLDELVIHSQFLQDASVDISSQGACTIGLEVTEALVERPL